MNLQTLVILSIIFNLSMNAVSSAGISVGASALPTLTTVQPNNLIDKTAIQQAAQCKASNVPLLGQAYTLICNEALQVASAFWGVALTFGVFLWGVSQVLPLLANAIAVPGQYLTNYGVPQSIVNIYNAAFYFLYLMWAYVLWTGRYNAEVS